MANSTGDITEFHFIPALQTPKLEASHVSQCQLSLETTFNYHLPTVPWTQRFPNSQIHHITCIRNSQFKSVSTSSTKDGEGVLDSSKHKGSSAQLRTPWRPPAAASTGRHTRRNTAPAPSCVPMGAGRGRTGACI